MRIAVRATEQQRQEWLSKPVATKVELLWVENEIPEADAFFDLLYEEQGNLFESINNKPVFLSAVTDTSEKLPANTSRINAWSSFLKRDVIELYTTDDVAKKVLEAMGWKFQLVPDIPGMIAARTVAMIINEAYFALGDNVSTKEEIDTAMKLGTNYPFGPFEWSEKIGLHKVYRLLKTLSITDNRYIPAAALEQELKSIA